MPIKQSCAQHHLIPTFAQLQSLLFCFLSLRPCLFWIFHINGIIHVGFCIWLLSLGIMLEIQLYELIKIFKNILHLKLEELAHHLKFSDN